MELSSTKKFLIKLFYTLNKTPLREMLEQPYYFLASQASSFLIHSLSRTQSARTPLTPSRKYFQNFSLKIYIFKIDPSKNTF